MKILITSDCYTPMVNGVVTSIKNLEAELRLMGHEVKILCPSNNIHCNETDEVYMIGSISVEKIYSGARAAFRMSRGHLEELVKWKPDIIHSQGEFTSFIMARKIAKAVGCPIVHTYHTMYENYTHYFTSNVTVGQKTVQILTDKIIKKVYGVIAPSVKIEEMLRRYGITKPIAVIPTGLDIKRFRNEIAVEKLTELKKNLGIPNSDKIFICVGRTAKEKNIDELINFFGRLNMKDARLLIVGGGPYLDELKKHAAEIGLGERVIFTGMVKPEDIPTYYRLGDVFLSASVSETQGLTYIEALASGVPAICRNDECLDGVIENGVDGFKYNNFEEFESAAKKLLSDRLFYESASDRARAFADKFSSEVFAEKVLGFYKVALENKSCE